MVFFICVGGIRYPVASSALGFSCVISRICYAFYLKENGPNNPVRVFGAILGDTAILGLFGLTVLTCLKHLK